MSGVLPNLAGLLARTTPGPWQAGSAGGPPTPDLLLFAAAPTLAQALIDAADALEKFLQPCPACDVYDGDPGETCTCGDFTLDDLRAVLVRLADIDKDIGP